MKREKGQFEYLKYQKLLKFFIMLIAYIVVLAVFFVGLAIKGTRNNPFTVAAILLVLPSAKFTVNFLVLAIHKATPKSLYEYCKQYEDKTFILYDAVFSNESYPIGCKACLVTEKLIYAYSDEKKASEKLFSESLEKFLANVGIEVKVELVKDEEAFKKKLQHVADSRQKADTGLAKRVRNNLLGILL